ncbi:MAG: carbohydrate kinase family protein [Kiritimatiellae bacterium]|jgi:sugar/nucleoside kinase (ribokinase family)|nr:carbohydrate kinase family protein [Kiritimatiellia bacterium]
MNKGIAVAGNMILDRIKMIDVFPEKGRLCNIKSQSIGIGGCVCNTAIDIAMLSDNEIKLYALGRLGKDENGQQILDFLNDNNIDTKGVIRCDTDTSYTDVMTIVDVGDRTFFHYRGANDEFCIDDIDFDNLNCDILHIGYALLLDKFDRKNKEYGTELAKALYIAQQKGIKTSIDVVSEQSDRFKEIVTRSLKYCDYITVNEIEAENVSNISLRDKDKKIIESNLKKACDFFIENGVKQVCIHFPEGCVAMNGNEYRQMPSLKLPDDYIKGNVGAGDAFCAGMLYAAYRGFSLKDSLVLAVCSASCSLSQADSISGMMDFQRAVELSKIYQFDNGIKII